ncbi:phosphoserine phosphatase isoform X2 [Chironomus tepperi]|uniref:phosphoserine phosphatase isoform X2 n=1 Tax=Chironomus tepperi TaxID=113505 RepID=UPI00391F527F
MSWNKSFVSLVAIASSTTNASNSLITTTMPQIQSLVRNINSTTTTGSKVSADSNKTKRILDAKRIIQSSDVVCFDVDSTVIIEEGIDELADFCGKGEEVSNLTKEAMGGSMTFQEALRRRLDIIKPTQSQIRQFLVEKPSTLSPHIKDFIDYLHSLNKKIYLISGGFHSLIDPVCKELGIPLTNLFANKLLFDYNGNYAGFDINQPTSRSGGKGDAITQIRDFNNSQLISNNQQVIVMIGDGATDLEACPPANFFIGYGGNIIRESVRERAQYYVTDFTQLM